MRVFEVFMRRAQIGIAALTRYRGVVLCDENFSVEIVRQKLKEVFSFWVVDAILELGQGVRDFRVRPEAGVSTVVFEEQGGWAFIDGQFYGEQQYRYLLLAHNIEINQSEQPAKPKRILELNHENV